MLPRELPVTWENLNWTPVTVGVALAVMLAAWYLPACGVRLWYHGKAHTLPDARPVRFAGPPCRAAPSLARDPTPC